MDLTKNPFRVLEASTRDSRARLTELAEQGALLGDEERTSNALNVLANPRRRVAAEMSWIPGVAPGRVAEVLAALDESPERVSALEGLPPLAASNATTSKRTGCS